jgi:hypothetical protein
MVINPALTTARISLRGETGSAVLKITFAELLRSLSAHAGRLILSDVRSAPYSTLHSAMSSVTSNKSLAAAHKTKTQTVT